MQFAIPVALCDPTELTAIARTADECGYGWIAVSDHLIYPREFSQPYPYTKDGKPRFSEDTNWPDPWIAISAMAAVTQQLRFYTNVYVLPARNPVHVAKFLSTLAVMSTMARAARSAAARSAQRWRRLWVMLMRSVMVRAPSGSTAIGREPRHAVSVLGARVR